MPFRWLWRPPERLKINGYEVVGEYVEVETGKGADALDRRPQLEAALNAARKRKAAVVVAKLDRLSRDMPPAFQRREHHEEERQSFLKKSLGTKDLKAANIIALR